jgi:hypothetical protein
MAIQAKPTTTVETLRVTVDNFNRAETHTYFARFVSEGAFGKLHHERELAPIDHQTVIRLNRDTLYSFGVFDLDAAPVTISLPEANERYIALQVIDEDHYAPEVVYDAGPHTISKEQVGTRYIATAIRIFVDPNDETDLAAVHQLQDAIEIEQASLGVFETPKWDQESLKKVRDAILALNSASGTLDSARMFGRKNEVDPVQHLLGTAGGWGGNPVSAAMYRGVVPSQNDGKTAYQLTVPADVPVDAFWSISVYNAGGFFEKNDQNAYSLNSVTGKKAADGSVEVQFGGDPSGADNYLPITAGWNYLVRLYRPRTEVLDGTWKFPEAQPMG